MSDQAKRIFCRLLFLVVCVVPTAIVLRWVVSPPTPTYYENLIKRNLGLASDINHVVTPLPQQTILEDVTIGIHGAGGRLELGDVTIANTERFRSIAAQQISVSNHELARLLQRCFPVVSESFPGNRVHRVRFAKIDVNCELFDVTENSIRTIELFRPQLEFIPKQSSLEIALRFRMSDDADAPEISVTCVKRNSEEAEEWTIDCGQAELPVLLLSELLPETKCLGDNARFSGLIKFTKHEGEWTGMANGEIRQADLAQMVFFQPFEQLLVGNASIRIHKCLVEGSKITSVEGILASNGGVVSGNLLQSLSAGLDTTALEVSLDQPTKFDHAQINFAIDRGTIRLRGLDQQPQVLVAFQSQDEQWYPLLQTRVDHAYPLERLIQALAGQREMMVPLNAQAMTSRLWLPAREMAPSDVEKVNQQNASNRRPAHLANGESSIQDSNVRVGQDNLGESDDSPIKR